ncbi:MAG: hypothetical protein GX557_07550, partial [Chloroflexi bacterium]|nr:hypothetical protein [Chloroflexota bacterium]
MNKCQHCGTELENPRAKNCKTCSAILTEANRRDSYSFVMEAIAKAKAAGLTGQDMHAEMRAAHAAGQANKAAFWNDFRERQKIREERRKRDRALPGFVEDARDDIEIA